MQKNKTQTAQRTKKLIILMFVQNFRVLAVLWGPLELILMRIKNCKLKSYFYIVSDAKGHMWWSKEFVDCLNICMSLEEQVDLIF